MESVVEDLIAGFLQTDPTYVFAITANIGLAGRLKALEAVARLRLEGDDLKRIIPVLDTAEKLAGFRNKVVHGLWIETEVPGLAVVFAVKSARKLKFQAEYMNLVYLQWLCEQIVATAQKFHTFGKEFGIIEVAGAPGS